MPSVLTFWQTMEDEAIFLKYLERDDIVAFPSDWRKYERDFKPAPLQKLITADGFRFCLRRHLADVMIEKKRFDKTLLHSVPTTSSSLIGYTRPKQEGMILHQSNLYYYPMRLVEKDSKNLLVAQTPDFIKWAKRVFVWVRKSTPEKVTLNGYPYRATDRVKKSVEDGEIVAVS